MTFLDSNSCRIRSTSSFENGKRVSISSAIFGPSLPSISIILTRIATCGSLIFIVFHLVGFRPSYSTAISYSIPSVRRSLKSLTSLPPFVAKQPRVPWISAMYGVNHFSSSSTEPVFLILTISPF